SPPAAPYSPSLHDALPILPVAVVPDARAALADVAAEFFDHPTRKLKLAAVTGTDGKTTTVHLVSDVLEASGAKTGFSTTVDFKRSEEHTSELQSPYELVCR